MSFTKYPILFSYGFPVVSVVLFAATLGVSLWIISSAIHHYRIPRKSTPNLVNGKNVDLIITFVIVFMVTAMDICEFFMHLFSDWTKVSHTFSFFFNLFEVEYKHLGTMIIIAFSYEQVYL